jgi:SAM-dependent methyltransferase
MEQVRKPFQGIFNIIRFNWHFYLITALILIFLLFIGSYTSLTLKIYVYILCLLIFLPLFISLLVSYYVYDRSGLYELPWIEPVTGTIVNINAGFDEVSSILKEKFKINSLLVLDFYNPEKHTEISIERARKAYPAFPGTALVSTNHLSLNSNMADVIFVIFAAHEIRNDEERVQFFKELKRILKPGGKIYITEHLRDFPNFLAYNIGFFHFFSKNSWLKIFASADLTLLKEIKFTPFISTFIVNKDGITL